MHILDLGNIHEKVLGNTPKDWHFDPLLVRAQFFTSHEPFKEIAY